MNGIPREKREIDQSSRPAAVNEEAKQTKLS